MPTGSEFWHFTTSGFSADWNGRDVGLFSRHKDSFGALNVSDSTRFLFSLLIELPGLKVLGYWAGGTHWTS